MLAINVLRITVADRHHSVGVVIAFAGLVYFELDAEITRTRTVKDRIGLIIVVLYSTVMLKVAVAVIAIWFVIIAITIVGIVRVNHAAAADTSIIMVVVAGVA